MHHKAVLSVAFMIAVSLIALSKLVEEQGILRFQETPEPEGNVFPVTAFSYCQGTPTKPAIPLRTTGTYSTYDKALGLIVVRNLPSSSYGYAVQNIHVEDPSDIRDCKVNDADQGVWAAASGGELVFEGCPCLAVIGLGVPEFYVP